METFCNYCKILWLPFKPKFSEICDTLALWPCGTLSLWHSVFAIPRLCDTRFFVTIGVWNSLSMWNSGFVTLGVFDSWLHDIPSLCHFSFQLLFLSFCGTIFNINSDTFRWFSDKTMARSLRWSPPVDKEVFEPESNLHNRPQERPALRLHP